MSSKKYEEVKALFERIEDSFSRNVVSKPSQGVFAIENTEDMFLEREPEPPFIEYLNDIQDYFHSRNYDDCLEQLKFAKREINSLKTLNNIVAEEIIGDLTKIQSRLYVLRRKDI